MVDHIIELIKTFLDEDGWNYSFNEEKKVFTSGINMNSVLGILKIYIMVFEESYTVFAKLQGMVEEGYYEKVSEYLHRANYGLQNGNFELDYNEGTIRYKTYVNFENIELSKEIIERSIYTPVIMFDRYGRGILKLMLGEGTPIELIDEAEKNSDSSD